MAAAVAHAHAPPAPPPPLPPHILAALGDTLSKKGEALPSTTELLQALTTAQPRDLPVLLPRLCLYGASPPRLRTGAAFGRRRSAPAPAGGSVARPAPLHAA